VRAKFRAIVTGTDVQRGKPDPQVFTVAAERLGVAPNRCVVFEDAPAGVAAARLAGMKCIALLSTGRTPDAVPDANRVVKSLREVTVDEIFAMIDEDLPAGD
jgi:beta-phosphoglucomutase-like phosphatase (HAD superfamily)